jgi:hypothetical protein
MVEIKGGSNMTGTNCDLFTHNQSRSYLNHLVFGQILRREKSRPERKHLGMGMKGRPFGK